LHSFESRKLVLGQQVTFLIQLLQFGQYFRFFPSQYDLAPTLVFHIVFSQFLEMD
jgi:hypothetical protein